MILTKTKSELQKYLTRLRQKGRVGFVPTMGALHRGHLMLVEKAMQETPVVVVSIFVNPTQFNDSRDLERYPRNLEADLELLESTGCQLVFAPFSEEIYPEPDTRKFDFGYLEQVMEGKHRPSHFNGVAQVVSKLFGLVKPDRAYFGMKDFQQLVIIKQLVKMLRLPVEIVPCPTIREENGLAMSSRNGFLSPEQRKNAAVIFETLQKAQKLTGKKSVQELERWVKETINKNPYLNVEYFKIVDDESLQPVENWNSTSGKVGCIAAFCGGIRLIDNIYLN